MRDGDEETKHMFELSNRIKIQQRVRYGVWQALGDVGGFYDGLDLIFGSIISQYAATKFLMSLFRGLLVDEQSQNAEKKKKQSRLADAIKNQEPDAFANKDNFRTLVDAIRNLNLFNFSLR